MADEKIYTVPLRDAFNYTRTKRARRAVKIVRAFVAKHSKVPEANVRISNALNSIIWARGIQKPPRRIKIKVIKEANIAKAYLYDEIIKKAEAKKEEEKVGEAPQEVKAEASEEKK